MSELSDAREEIAPPDATPPLGPGDDDPRSIVRGTASEVRTPLGPGDDDGVERGTAAPATPPPGPGDGPESDVVMIAPPPPGPGAIDTGPRRVTLFPKKKPAAEGVPVVAERSSRRSRRATQ